MSQDLTLVSSADLIDELGRRSNHLFLSADLPDAQAQSPAGRTGFLTVAPARPDLLMETIIMVAQSMKAISQGDNEALLAMMAVFGSTLMEGDDNEG